jgi:hypothetical protein
MIGIFVILNAYMVFGKSSIDYQSYLGKWIHSNTPYLELIDEKGGSILEITEIKNSVIAGTCATISGSSGHSVADIEFKGKLVGNKAKFHYEDSFLNVGTAVLLLEKDRIIIEFNTQISAENSSGWSVGNGKCVYVRPQKKK